MLKLICFVGSMDAGGAETFLMKIYRTIDKRQCQFDFIVNIKSKGFYDEEIKELGGKIFYSPPKSKNIFGNLIQNYKIVKDGKYDAALRMTDHSLGTIDLLVARCVGVRKLILRSTNAGSTGGLVSFILHRLFFFLPKYVPTIKIAPSEAAAEYLWGARCVKNGTVKILHNGIPLDKYCFSNDKRETKRHEMGLNDKVVVGHIGRFNTQKNHEFLLNVFAEIYHKHENARLVLVGVGELEPQIKEQARLLNISEAIVFTGLRTDIPELLMAMDVFVFPSIFEGLPNVLVEAQAAGLPCVISSNITKEVVLTNLVRVLSLKDDAVLWSKESIDLMHYGHVSTINTLKELGYDIFDVVTDFQNYLVK